MTIFQYATLPAEDVKLIFHRTLTTEIKDAYLTRDEPVKRLESLLAEGYRWIRTDGEVAVFERTRIAEITSEGLMMVRRSMKAAPGALTFGPRPGTWKPGDPVVVENPIREALANITANARRHADPRMEGKTDCYLVPLDDIEAARKALKAEGGAR